MIALLDAPEFAAAKDALSTTLEHVEQARQGRLKFLQDALNRTEDELERVKKQALWLPTDIARYRAEIARLEASTADDLLREAVGALKAECPIPGCEHIAEDGTCGHHLEVVCPALAEKKQTTEEPFIPGLPPEALRKVWPEWEDEAGDVVTFKDGQYHWAHWRSSTPVRFNNGDGWSEIGLRPHGATRAHVEALAQQAQTPKPHACPRCDEGMRALERTALATGLEGAIPPPSKWCDGSRKG